MIFFWQDIFFYYYSSQFNDFHYLGNNINNNFNCYSNDNDNNIRIDFEFMFSSFYWYKINYLFLLFHYYKYFHNLYRFFHLNWIIKWTNLNTMCSIIQISKSSCFFFFNNNDNFILVISLKPTKQINLYPFIIHIFYKKLSLNKIST